MPNSYLLQEDNASKFTLEDGSGFIILETSVAGGTQLYQRTIRGNRNDGQDDWMVSYQV